MRTLSLTLLLLIAASPLRAEEDPKTTLERAVKAYGGEEKLARLRQARAKVKGNGDVAFTGSVTMQLPGRLRSEYQYDGGSTMIAVLDGGKGWLREQGKTQALDGDRLEELKEEVYASHVETLLPLLKEEEYTLTALGESKVNDRAAVGIRVTAKGHRDIELYFDQADGLLVKVARTVRGPADKEVLRETFYSDFRDVRDGPRQPHKARVEQDGKKLLEMEVIDLRLLDKLDDETFAKP